MICVAPFPMPVCSADGFCMSGAQGFRCESGKVSLKVDTRKAVLWPKRESLSLRDLEPEAEHRVVLLCDGKARQSFKFRFGEFKRNRACLFVNDLYGWVQLWDLDKRAPWCKCRE
jgi:hypothetical protein